MRTPDTGGRARPPRCGAVVIGAAAALVMLAACGSGSGGYGSSGAAATTTAVAPASAPAAAKAAGTKVTATLTEFHIALSQQTFPAGTYTFVVTNSGTTTHALSVDGPGVSDQHTDFLQPGSSADLTVTLRSGTYDFFCPVANHKALGMNMNVSVNVGAGGAMTSMPGMTTAPAAGGGGNSGGY